MPPEPPAPYRTRFAPSPTGEMHLGHARTHLVAWLRARAAGGRIVMRIDDLDPPRVRPGAAEAILRDHEWLGLDWDEGPVHQSSPERQAAYREALAQLDAEGRLYPCTCSRREWMEVASAPHDGGPPRYPGTCRAGPSHPEREAAARFRLEGRTPRFVDGLAGPAGDADEGDFVVRRADGLVAYQLAVVVDDRDQGITEVVRGDDLLSATGLQLALFAALRAAPPAFLHVPLVVGADGSRLAKRHGAPGIRALREAGRTAEEVLGGLGASLGLLPGRHPATLDELLARAAELPAALPREPAHLPELASGLP
ncbi:MAG: tRNA glutamyl-Q(34) synthetase GluQRS [Myxococcota bacterium]